MSAVIQGALTEAGVTDQVLAAGQFNPRGHSGGLFAGGLAGSEAAGVLGEAAGAIGLGAGSLAGMRAADTASGLPASMLVGATGSRIELEGSRVPLTHSEDVIAALHG